MERRGGSSHLALGEGQGLRSRLSVAPPTPRSATVSPAVAVVTWAATMAAVGGVFSGSGGGLTAMVISASGRQSALVGDRQSEGQLRLLRNIRGGEGWPWPRLRRRWSADGVPHTWLQAKVRDSVAVSASPPTPCSATVSPAVAVVTWAATMAAVGGVLAGSGTAPATVTVTIVSESDSALLIGYGQLELQRRTRPPRPPACVNLGSPNLLVGLLGFLWVGQRNDWVPTTASTWWAIWCHHSP